MTSEPSPNPTTHPSFTNSERTKESEKSIQMIFLLMGEENPLVQEIGVGGEVGRGVGFPT